MTGEGLSSAFATKADNVEAWEARQEDLLRRDETLAESPASNPEEHLAMQAAADAAVDAGLGDGSPVTAEHQVGLE